MTTETQTTEAPQLTLTDLQGLLRVIDAAAERGAFKGNELSAVGTLRDKVAAFLEAASAPVAQAETAPEA